MGRANENTPDECLTELAGMLGLPASPDADINPQQLIELSQVIEGEIVPRLMMLFDTESTAEDSYQAPDRDTDRAPAAAASLYETLGGPREFVGLLLNHDAAIAIEYIDKLRSSGFHLPEIYLSLLAPAARELGEMWENDECSFVNVTVGVSRMQQVLMHFSPSFCGGYQPSPDTVHQALILTVPNEQHNFGLHMVTEFFRRNGWDVVSAAPKDSSELAAMVSRDEFNIVGCSLSAEKHLEELTRDIKLIRKFSKNKDIKIIVGGRLFNNDPTLYRTVGADAMAEDGEDAVRMANAMVMQPPK